MTHIYMLLGRPSPLQRLSLGFPKYQSKSSSKATHATSKQAEALCIVQKSRKPHVTELLYNKLIVPSGLTKIH